MHNQFENSHVIVFRQNWQFYLIEVKSLLSHWLWLNHFGPTFGPILVQLTHFVTGVSSNKSNNLMYALVVVSILKNVQWAKVLGLYFKNWLFGPNLAQIWPNLAQFGPIWPNLVHIKACNGWHHVSSALEVLMTFKNMLRLKIYSLRGQK